MRLVQLISATFAAVVIAGSVSVIARAQAPLATVDGQLAEQKNPYIAPQLNRTWYETEGDWQGTWIPANPGSNDGVFNATWRLGRQHEQATLQITMTPAAVTIVRTQRDGQTCRYQGYPNAAGTVVNGTFTCDWARRPMNWRASIGSRVTPSQAGDIGAAAAVFDYLRVDWAAHEGDWHGRWTQINPGTGDGNYQAHWSKGNERASATMQMSVDAAAGRMTVRRRDPDGRQCTYTGAINPNTLRSVEGTYRCTGQDNFLPWRATVILPQR